MPFCHLIYRYKEAHKYYLLFHYIRQIFLAAVQYGLHSDAVFVEFTDKIHGRVARYVSPLSRGQHLSTVLVVIGVVGFSFPPFAESGHGRAIHVGEKTLSVQVMNANVDSAQACLGNVSCNGHVGSLILGHGQVPSPRLTVDLSIGVALLLLHQQIDFTVCLFYASNSCRGGQC